MSGLDVFRFEAQEIRTVLIDGEPWFVLADIVAALGLARSASAVVDRLDDGVRQTYPIQDSLGRGQRATVVSEAGVYEVVIRSDAPAARDFRRWLTRDVIPAIRRTGSYSAPKTSLEIIRDQHESIGILLSKVEQKDAAISDLTPRAEAWDDLASAAGDYSAADAANILKRAGIDTGPQRLFEKLHEIRWTYRGEGRRWRPYARALDEGYLCERAMPPRTDHDGILVPVPPQVRITARGLERLRVRLGTLTALEASA